VSGAVNGERAEQLAGGVVDGPDVEVVQEGRDVHFGMRPAEAGMAGLAAGA
jgi:hypothetical protein